MDCGGRVHSHAVNDVPIAKIPDASPGADVRIDRSGPLFERVRVALDGIRPMLQQDGGDAVLLEIEDESIAIIRFTGACAGCPMSSMTLRYGVSTHLQSTVPEILAVDVVADQAVAMPDVTSILEHATFTSIDGSL